MFPLGGADGPGSVTTWAIFILLTAPFVFLLRAIGRLARVRYGFAEFPEDDGPPLRVCAACHNSVLEADYRHCPYCGEPLDSSGVDAAA